MTNDDWDAIRKNKYSSARVPDYWGKEVRPISQQGLALFGIHDRDGRLYWDGAEVQVSKKLELRWYELVLAVMAAVGTFGSFVLQLTQALGLWFTASLPIAN